MTRAPVYLRCRWGYGIYFPDYTCIGRADHEIPSYVNSSTFLWTVSAGFSPHAVDLCPDDFRCYWNMDLESMAKWRHQHPLTKDHSSTTPTTPTKTLANVSLTDAVLRQCLRFICDQSLSKAGAAQSGLRLERRDDHMPEYCPGYRDWVMQLPGLFRCDAPHLKPLWWSRWCGHWDNAPRVAQDLEPWWSPQRYNTQTWTVKAKLQTETCPHDPAVVAALISYVVWLTCVLWKEMKLQHVRNFLDVYFWGLLIKKTFVRCKAHARFTNVETPRWFIECDSSWQLFDQITSASPFWKCARLTIHCWS